MIPMLLAAANRWTHQSTGLCGDADARADDSNHPRHGCRGNGLSARSRCDPRTEYPSPAWRGSSRALAHATSAFLNVSQGSLKTRARRRRSVSVVRRQTLTLDAMSQSPTHTATPRTVEARTR